MADVESLKTERTKLKDDKIALTKKLSAMELKLESIKQEAKTAVEKDHNTFECLHVKAYVKIKD